MCQRKQEHDAWYSGFRVVVEDEVQDSQKFKEGALCFLNMDLR